MVLALSLVGGCSQRGGLGATIVGTAMTLGGVAIVRADPGCRPEEWLCIATDTQIGGGLLAVSGLAFLITGAIMWATAPPEAEGPPPPPLPPWGPMLVDPNRRATEKDRLATQASLAARRGDCTGTQVAMKRIGEIDVAFYDRLRRGDASIASCMTDLPW